MNRNASPLWINRADAKRILGVASNGAFFRILREHGIESRREVEGGALWYARDAVIQATRSRAQRAVRAEEQRATTARQLGPIVKHAYRLFAEKRPLVDVAVALGLTGEEVAELHRTWRQLRRP